MLAFETDWRSGAGPELYVVRPDGTALRNLTGNPSLTPNTLEASSDPAWAPDGSRVLFIQAQVLGGAFGLDLHSIPTRRHRADGRPPHARVGGPARVGLRAAQVTAAIRRPNAGVTTTHPR
jgi:hypothetical protein